MNENLIVGATGVLGRQVFSQLKEKTEDVRGISNSESGKDLNLVDLNHPTDFAPMIAEYNYYLAQSRRYRDYPDGISDLANINILRPLELAQLAFSNNRRFLYTSTGSVYTTSLYPLYEDSELVSPNQLNPYIASKLFAEQSILKNFPDSLLIRPFYIFGSGAKGSLFTNLATSIYEKKPITLEGSKDGLLINPIPSKDAATILIKLMKAKYSGVFNIAGQQSISIREIAEIMGSAIGNAPVFTLIPGEAKKFLGAIQKLEEKVDFEYSNLEEEIREFAEDFINSL
jgi:nucleoside-diphosphate-sugar epimerase